MRHAEIVSIVLMNIATIASVCTANSLPPSEGEELRLTTKRHTKTNSIDDTRLSKNEIELIKVISNLYTTERIGNYGELKFFREQNSQNNEILKELKTAERLIFRNSSTIDDPAGTEVEPLLLADFFELILGTEIFENHVTKTIEELIITARKHFLEGKRECRKRLRKRLARAREELTRAARLAEKRCKTSVDYDRPKWSSITALLAATILAYRGIEVLKAHYYIPPEVAPGMVDVLKQAARRLIKRVLLKGRLSGNRLVLVNVGIIKPMSHAVTRVVHARVLKKGVDELEAWSGNLRSALTVALKLAVKEMLQLAPTELTEQNEELQATLPLLLKYADISNCDIEAVRSSKIGAACRRKSSELVRKTRETVRDIFTGMSRSFAGHFAGW